MLLWMIVKVALKSLSANKLRSMLAMLGIIIGVGAVIAMLAIGAGARSQVIARFTAMGTNLLVVRPGQRAYAGVMNGTQQNLTVEDAQDLLKLDGVSAVAPSVSRTMQIKYLAQNAQTTVLGTCGAYLPIRDFQIGEGRIFSEQDIDRWAHVAVLGPVTVNNLFGASDPIDQVIKINGINFRVIGVLKSKGDQGWFNPDDQIIVPYTTAMHILLGVVNIREIDIQVDSADDVDNVQAAVFAEIRKLHKVQPGQPDDVEIRNQAEFLQSVLESNRTFQVLLGSVAGISLLVGGIGIMNIMLVTVTERTREIGIRKAIGARNSDILSQFLLEALLMSGVGGLIGAGAGVGTAWLIDNFTFFPAIVQSYSVMLALGVSAAVGIFFGYYPAMRAARLDPIEALRYE